jgi:hypothetical protein
VKCKHNPIFSDELLKKIHAHFSGKRVYVLLLGCRVSDDLTLSPRHSPKSQGEHKPTFGGTKHLKRKTKTSKRIKRIKSNPSKKNVNRRSQRR